MENIAVLYQSRYGATEKYANWISEELGCPKFEISHVKVSELKKYDKLIVAGGLYAGKINGFKFVRKHYDELKDKEIIVIAVGVTPYSEDTIKAVRAMNLKELFEHTPIFLCPGAWDISKMNFRHKLVCKMMRAVMKAKSKDEGKNVEEDEVKDLTTKDALVPVYEYINSLE